MKIKSFIPFVISNNSEAVISTFEKLGFEKHHVKLDANSGANPSTNMKNPDGFKIDVNQSDNMPRDMVGIRINVEDFDEAYNELIALGFKNAQGERVAHSSSDEACMMISPTGFAFILCKHIK